MTDLELDVRIRELVGEVARRAPEPLPFPAEQVTGPAETWPIAGDSAGVAGGRQRRWLLPALVVVGLIALGVAALWWDGGDGSTVVTTDDSESVDEPLVRVQRELLSYEQSGAVVCPLGDGATVLPPVRMTLELVGSPELGRWRQTITYPDDFSRSVLVVGDPFYPTQVFAGGTGASDPVLCDTLGILLAEPAQDSLFFLNPPVEPPLIGGDESAVPSYSDLGELVAGNYTSESGRPVDLWRQTINGSYVTGTGESSLVQVTEWRVDKETGQVLERWFRQEYEGVGDVSWRAVLQEADEIDVAESWFDTDEVSLLIDESDSRPAQLELVGTSVNATLGGQFLWPARPLDESPESVSERFANFIRWAPVEVVSDGDAGGPVWVEITNQDGRTLRALTIPSPRGRVIIQIGEPMSVGIGPGGALRLFLPEIEGAASLEIIISDGVQSQTWLLVNDVPNPLQLGPEVGIVHSALVIFRDGSGQTLSVASYSST